MTYFHDFFQTIPSVLVVTIGTCHCCHCLGSRGSSRPRLTRYRTFGLLWAPLAKTELIQICKMRLLKFFCSCNFCISASTSELLQFYTEPRLNWPTPKKRHITIQKGYVSPGGPPSEDDTNVFSRICFQVSVSRGNCLDESGFDLILPWYELNERCTLKLVTSTCATL